MEGWVGMERALQARGAAGGDVLQGRGWARQRGGKSSPGPRHIGKQEQ